MVNISCLSVCPGNSNIARMLYMRGSCYERSKDFPLVDNHGRFHGKSSDWRIDINWTGAHGTWESNSGSGKSRNRGASGGRVWGTQNSIPKPLSDLSGTFALAAQTRKGQGRNEGWDGKKKSPLNGRKEKRWLLFQGRWIYRSKEWVGKE